MALSEASLDRIMRKYRQRVATTGIEDPAYLRQLYEAELSVATQKGLAAQSLVLEEERFKESQRQFEINKDITEKTLEQQEEAAKLTGAVQIGSTAIQAGMLLKDTEIGSKALAGASSLIPSIGEAAPTITTSSAIPSAVSGVAPVPETVGITTATETAPLLGLGSTVGLPALAGFGAGQLGKSITKAGQPGHMGGERLTSGAIGAAGGAMLGFSVGGPLGAVVGGIAGAISGGSVICSELNRQGLIDDYQLVMHNYYRIKFVSDKTYNGYLILAKPIVRLMKKSKLATKIVSRIVNYWSGFAMSKINNSGSSLIGRVINYFGTLICNFVFEFRTRVIGGDLNGYISNYWTSSSNNITRA